MNWIDKPYNFEPPETIPGLVSIVMPTYNRRARVKERIREIINSTYTNWELIIVCDGGDDIIWDLIPWAYKQKIRVIELPQNSQSVSIPRSIGISYARGEFICPADDDVIFHKDKLDILLNHIVEEPLVYGARLELDEKTQRIITPATIINWNPLERSGVDNGQMLYRKDVYDKIPYIVSTHACDYHLAREIFKHFGKFAYTPHEVCTYIWHSSNRTHSPDRKKSPLRVDLFKNFYNVQNDIKIIREE